MATSRRVFLKGSAATAAALSAPGILKAQPAPTRARTLRAVLHGDLQVFDPIWTTANMTGNHGLLIYDTLFGIDESRTPQPQMVDKWGVSDDKKTYTFSLRAGQKFHDGQDVTSADVVASIRRWAVRDGAAQHMFRRVADTPVKDETTFQIVLKEPYGLVTRRDRQARDQPAGDHAQEGRRDGRKPAGDDQGRLRRLHVQRARDAIRSALRLRQESELRGPQRAAIRHGRRQSGEGRSHHHREHGRPADRGRGTEGGRNRFLRDRRRSTCSTSSRAIRTSSSKSCKRAATSACAVSTGCIRRSTRSRRVRPCCT